MEVIYRTNRVIAGTGWPPKYQSITWSRHCYKRLVMGGSLFCGSLGAGQSESQGLESMGMESLYAVNKACK